MRRTLAVVLLLAGCSSDPVTDPLPAGSEATIDADKPIAVSVGPGIEELPPGAKVRVVEDPPDAQRSRYREVRILVLEGPHANRNTVIGRQHLRSLPR